VKERRKQTFFKIKKKKSGRARFSGSGGDDHHFFFMWPNRCLRDVSAEVSFGTIIKLFSYYEHESFFQRNHRPSRRLSLSLSEGGRADHFLYIKRLVWLYIHAKWFVVVEE
jgi:hypothetical protein